MTKLAAGILVFRRSATTVEVLLVHPGGPFWAKKDDGAWSLPKGEYAEAEDLLAAAKREFKEETSFTAPEGEYIDLGEVKYSNKVLKAWAAEGNADAKQASSNTFTMEWPPKSGKSQEFPEIDRADWFALAQAKAKLVKGQTQLIDALAAKLGLEVVNESSDQLSLL